MGVKKTTKTIPRLYNWPGMYKDVAAFVQGCLMCQRSRRGTERLQGYCRTHPIPALPFHTVYLEQDYPVLTMIDQATKWAEATPLSSKRHCVDVIEYLDLSLMTDQGANFTSHLMMKLCNDLGITKLTTCPYHPQGNSTVESFHRNLNKGAVCGGPERFAETLETE
eukprot:GHVO01052232.1.p1 GENE.GHVO01052232.1~~GHVO01052232.1.p1  ORF type:complete len:166 (+),score=16.33 GHVO01052232.1:409-906(+)